MRDEDWMGDTDPNNVAGGADAAPIGGPVQVAPGVWAGDFVNGNGALGMRVDPAAQAVESAEPATGAAAPDDVGWGPPTPPPDGTDVYQWGRHLGDQGIAYRIKDGKLSVFERRDNSEPERPWGAVGTVEYVRGQTSDQPKDWRRYPEPNPGPSQDLSHPYDQDLDAYRTAVGYLRRSPLAGKAIDQFDRAQIPVVMVPDAHDRFGHVVGNGYAPVVYWDPTSALLTTDRTPDPLTGVFPNPLDELSDKSSLLGLQSPALGLLHEIGHALSFRANPLAYNGRVQARLNDGWTNKEERRNITEFESPNAEFLGEPTRTNHFNFDLLRMKDPTSHWPGRDLD